MSTSTSPAARLLKSVNEDPLLEGDPMNDAESDATDLSSDESDGSRSSYNSLPGHEPASETAPQTIALPLARDMSGTESSDSDGPTKQRFDTFFDAVPDESDAAPAAETASNQDDSRDAPADESASSASSEASPRIRSESSHNDAPHPDGNGEAGPAPVSLMPPSVLFTPPPFSPTRTVQSLRASSLRTRSLPAASSDEMPFMGGLDALPASQDETSRAPSGDGAIREDIQPPGSASITTEKAPEPNDAVRQAVVPVDDANAGILGNVNDLIDDGWRLQRMDVEDGSIVRIHLIHHG